MLHLTHFFPFQYPLYTYTKLQLPRAFNFVRDIKMTKVNDPGKDDDSQDNFRDDDEHMFRNNVRMNGIQDEEDSSSGDDNMDNEENQNNGYQLLPQELPHTDQQATENFADFDRHFQPQSDIETTSSTVEPSGNPSIQGMIQQARKEQTREQIQETADIFSSSAKGEATGTASDTITLDKNKIETIKSSMSTIKLNSEPPKWLKEMSEDEWNNMLKNKIKK